MKGGILQSKESFLHGKFEFQFYIINGEHKLFCNQSIWIKTGESANVTHVHLLQVGDIIYDDNDQEIVIESIELTTQEEQWWRFEISGDHSYIADGISLHNASRFLVTGGTGNWNSTTNWSATDGGGSGASFPVSTDTVALNTNSGATNITVNVASACTSIIASGSYTGILTFNATLTVGGTVTFISGMGNFAGTSDLICNTTATLTSGGKTLTGGLQLKGTSQTYTIADDWTINGTLTLSGTTLITVNGAFNINVGGSLTVSTITGGTATIVMVGTGSWTSGASTTLRLNLTINTAGTFTVSGTVYFAGGATMTYTSGTVVTTSSTLTLFGATCSLNVANITWNIVTINSSATVTLLADLNCTTLNSTVAASTNTFNGLFNVNISGSFTATGITTGTATIVLTGTGTWSGLQIVRMNLTINTSGTITISGSVAFDTGTLTYITGTVITTSSTLNIARSSTLDINGISWNDVLYLTTTTITTLTLNSLFTVNGDFTNESSAPTLTFAGTAPFTVNTLIIRETSIPTTRTVAFTVGNNYVITTTFRAYGLTTNHIKLQSVTAGTLATLKLSTANNYPLIYCDATDIGSSTGKLIWSWGAVLSNTANWNNLAVPKISQHRNSRRAFLTNSYY